VTAEKYSAGIHARTELPVAAAVTGIGLAVAIAVPSILFSRRGHLESAAVGNLRTLGSAQATFLSQHGRFGTFSELVAEQMLDTNWTNGVVRDGYRFTQISATKDTFEFKAEPAESPRGQRAFNIIEDFVIRYGQNGVAPRRKGGRPLGT
jgi:hypothetical protein